MAGVKLDGISKSYPAETDGVIRVLDGLSLSVADGEFYTLVGPSGCGKTTLLHIVAGLEPPDEGRVTLPGDGRLGFVFQEPRLLAWETIGRVGKSFRVVWAVAETKS